MQPDSPPPARYAALFRHGSHQAVRIPKEFEFEGDHVRISREGSRLVLEPVTAPKRLIAVLAEMGPVDLAFPNLDENLPRLDEDESMYVPRPEH